MKFKVYIIFLIVGLSLFATDVYYKEDGLYYAKNSKAPYSGYGEVDDEAIEYKGYFKNGLFDGYGEFYSTNGGSYFGNYKNGKYSGKGVLRWGRFTNDKYIGEFKDNKFNGNGTLITDNVKSIGYFKNNELVSGNYIRLLNISSYYIENASVISSYKTITDIDNWNHSTKDVFYQNNAIVEKVDLYNNQTFPIFYVNLEYVPITNNEKYKDNNYFISLLTEIAKANGYWDFAVYDFKDDFIFEVFCNKKTKSVERIEYNNYMFNKS